MSFCPECGRQLSDGEVCNCQAQNTQQVQPDAQTQSIQQVQPDAQTQSTQQAPKQTSPMVKELTDLLSGIFKKPADAVKKYVSNASMEAPAILILVLAFISALGELLRMLYVNFTTKSSLKSLADLANLISGKTKAYSAGQIATGFFTRFVEVIAIAALTAAIIMLIINAFEKDKKVTYKQTLAIASLSILVTIPFTFAGTIIAMIPASFFGYLKSWMISFANGAGLVLTFIGIKEIEKDDDNMPLVYGLAALASAVLSTILGLLFK